MKDIEQAMLWRSLDRPGHDSACWGRCADGGQRLFGTAVFDQAGQPGNLGYSIDMDAAWAFRSASVFGTLGCRPVDLHLVRDTHGRWQCNGRPQPALDGCAHLDLQFSPAAQVGLLKWLALAVGEHARSSLATLQVAPQSLQPRPLHLYRRSRFVYELMPDGAEPLLLTVDAGGALLSFAGRWQAEQRHGLACFA